MPYLEQPTYGFVRNRKFSLVLPPLTVVNAVAILAAKANLEVKVMGNLGESDEHGGERGGATKPFSAAVSVENGAAVSVENGVAVSLGNGATNPCGAAVSAGNGRCSADEPTGKWKMNQY